MDIFQKKAAPPVSAGSPFSVFLLKKGIHGTFCQMLTAARKAEKPPAGYAESAILFFPVRPDILDDEPAVIEEAQRP